MVQFMLLSMCACMRVCLHVGSDEKDDERSTVVYLCNQ